MKSDDYMKLDFRQTAVFLRTITIFIIIIIMRCHTGIRKFFFQSI